MAGTTLAEMEAVRRSEDLDHLLILWHNWQRAGKVARGYNDRTAVAGERYRTSRQHDDWNGKLDEDLDESRCKEVDFHVDSMQDPHRAAIYVLARNLTTGRAVWLSPRLPSDKAERDELVAQARQILTGRLVSAGVIE